MDKLMEITAEQMAMMEKRPYFITNKTVVPADDFNMAKHGRIASVIYPPGYRYRWSHTIDLSQWRRDPLMGWVWRGVQ